MALKTAAETPSSRQRARRAADAVVSALENRIYTGEIKGGSRLPAERELSEEFGISRTVAREAIKILGGKGLIDSRPGYRPIARSPDYDVALGALSGMAQHLLGTADGTKNIFQARLFCEAALARMAATDANKAHIAGLREALKNNGACVRHSELFYETDMAFHAVLYTIPENPIFPALHRAFCQWMAGHWRQMAHLPPRNERNFQAHQKIFEAILNRNPDEAETLMHRHMQEAWTQVEHTFNGES